MKTSRRAPLQAQTSGLVLHTNLTLIEVADPLLPVSYTHLTLPTTSRV